MKLLFLVLIAFAFVFTGCDVDNEDKITGGETTLQIKNESSRELAQTIFRSVLFTSVENADIIGTWTGTSLTSTAHTLRLDITNTAWTAIIQSTNNYWNNSSSQGTWIRNGNSLAFTAISNSAYYPDYQIRSSTATLSGNILTFRTGGINTLTFGLICDNLQIPTIKSGTSVTKPVEAGEGYIFLNINNTDFRTNELVIAENNKKTEFTFTNNTLLIDVNNPNNTVALGGALITVKQGNTIIEQHGEYSFGTVRINNTKEVTFTIANSGGSNLTIENVNGNRINLTDNNSGLYEVNLQPLSQSISPNNNTTFTIRFSPTATGNNFAATVNIKTNSNISDFAFRIIGNCSNDYQIGDTGPGGGMVFFVQGGQYKECSGELGSFNWSTAMTTASSYKGGGFSDWYLPSSGELDLLYENLHKKGLGGFSNNYYWSSTTASSSSSYATSKNFSSGSMYTTDYRTALNRVRAVRSFTLN